MNHSVLSGTVTASVASRKPVVVRSAVSEQTIVTNGKARTKVSSIRTLRAVKSAAELSGQFLHNTLLLLVQPGVPEGTPIVTPQVSS
jgi:hypothetical protein